MSKTPLKGGGGFSPLGLQGNGRVIASATGDLGTGTERLVLFVRPRPEEGRGGYKTTRAKRFSAAAGFSNQSLVRAASSASLFPGCSMVLPAARGQELVQPPALGRGTHWFWEEVCAAEKESWSWVWRNGNLRKSFSYLNSHPGDRRRGW